MVDRQMELGFGKERGCRAVSRRQRRLGRATWWFERMRQVVEHAAGWAPAPPPRPEQICFSSMHRQPGTASWPGPTPARPDSHERHMCE